MKGKYRYRVTLAPLDGDAAPLSFEAASHDDLIAHAGRARQQGDFDEDTAAAFVVGLKLLGGVLLQNKDHPLFADFAPHYGEFMRRVKARAQGEAHG